MRSTEQKGFTLIETLLVLVIISSIILLALNYQTKKMDEIKRDKTIMQFQQIINATLVYRLNTSTWPQAINDLSSNGYLPNKRYQNPWGYPYFMSSSSNKYIFYVFTFLPVAVGGNPTASSANLAFANALAGVLPFGYASGDPGGGGATIPDPNIPCTAASGACIIVASVLLPGQDLNNARSVNFSNVYHHKDCVPAPSCPTGMTPQIFVVPTSVSGFNDVNSSNVYPLENFTAYAVGQAGGSGPSTMNNVGDCDSPTTSLNCAGQPNVNYWRVCLSITTAKGRLQDTNPPPAADWQSKVSVLAVTRCAPANEPVGQPFVYIAPPAQLTPRARFTPPAPLPPTSLGPPTVGPFNPLAQ